ncbi:nuclear transport factor 2 family protein [Sphingosinicella sp. CPCC 101087]|uniref:nuclear transport factor 2 family protein n=1 Tax=Sphingosinicella sp. CPCC 101087 TaxID=2497754 RepID=UPI00101DEF93|nr:nuclear transport factor 2 family protein [Sphingosinicella sp. CPCC 101087]
MRLRIAFAAGLLFACAAPVAAAGSGEQRGAEQTFANREIVERFVDLLYRQGRVREAFETYVHEDYIQHNPLAADGRAAAIAALEPYFASQPEAVREVHRIIVDGDLAAVHVRARQNPQDRGVAIVDIVRLDNGKIVEHWDVIQPVPEQSANPHPMF